MMNLRVLPSALALLFLALPAAAHSEKSLKAHVHGSAQLTIALEDDKSLQVDLDSPADSIVGFEHKARSEPDKKTQAAALAHLEKGLSQLVEFPGELGCKVSDAKVGMEAEEHEAKAVKKPAAAESAHGEHSDVNATFALKCEKPVTGHSAKIGLIGLFPKVKSVSVKVLGPTAQNEKKMSRNGESIEF